MVEMSFFNKNNDVANINVII